MANVYNKPIVVLGGGAELPIDNGIIYEGKYRVRYLDIDGTILKIEYVAKGGNLNPPNNPSYDPSYLVFKEWNYDLENYLAEQPVDIGATYNTIDNATYIFCSIKESSGLNVNLKIQNFISIDWGDGTVDTNTSHTYTKEDNYIIKIVGSVNFMGGSTSAYLMGTTSNNYNVKKIYLGDLATIGSFCFRGLRNLEVISFSVGFPFLGNSILSYSNIKHITLPRNTQKLQGYCLKNLESLKTISIPYEVKTIDSNAFENDYSLEFVTITKNVTKCGQAFSSCNNLNDVNFPQYNNYELGDFAFVNNMLRATFIFDEIPPTTNLFFTNKKNITLWVNDDVIEDLKVTDDWSTYASQMKPLSWYPSITNPNA